MGRITNLTTGGVVADRVEVARGWRRRLLGLLGRRSLGEGEALMFPRCQSIHTWGMRCAIDVIFLRRNQVLKVAERVGPCRLVTALRADTVVELAAGTLDRTAVRPGTRLDITL